MKSLNFITDWLYSWSDTLWAAGSTQCMYVFFSRRPEICDSQCPGGELRNHILQRWLLWDDRLLETRHHAEAVHLRLPPRWPDRQGGHRPGDPGFAGVRGAQGGDHLPPQGWWVSNPAKQSHSKTVSQEESFALSRLLLRENPLLSSLFPLHDVHTLLRKSVRVASSQITPFWRFMSHVPIHIFKNNNTLQTLFFFLNPFLIPASY